MSQAASNEGQPLNVTTPVSKKDTSSFLLSITERHLIRK